MLTHPTLEQMASLGLSGMAAAWHALAEQDPGEAFDRNEWLGMMLDREVAHRADKRFANRLRNTKMRFPNACIEDINFTATRGLDRRQILSLGQGGWLVLWIWQASEVLEATARHAIYGVQWRRLDRKWLGLLKDRS
jgi:hypothetical protein